MILSLLATAAIVLAAPAAKIPLTVSTSQGSITGHVAPNVSSVIEFLGIPYAQPPVGPLRFGTPVPINTTTSYIAANFGADCPDTPNPNVGYPLFTPQAQQVINEFSANTGTPQSEDCLTLNVWTPNKATKGGIPVLIFLYGGRFTYGHTNSPFFDGEFLANAENVVVVTINYRTNLFGFPGAPGHTQNAGLRDSRLAVEWLQTNVASFGGNPALMTLFGQSAGAVAIDYWAYAYQTNPIVAGLISESGNALSFPVNTAADTLSHWYNVSGAVGCGTTGDTFPCMLTKNWTDLKAAAAKTPSASSGNPLRGIPAFYPVPDGETVFSNYTLLAEQGAFAKLPYLLGNNDNEQGYYALPDYRKNITVTLAEGDSFLLGSFTCPNQFEADARRAQNVPVWVYRYFGDWANVRLFPPNPAFAGQVLSDGSGAYHGAELEMVFGNPSGVSGIANTKAETQVIALIQGAWAAFARSPATGLSWYGWPKYNPATKSLIRLAYNNSVTPSFVSPSLYFAGCVNATSS